MSGPIKSTLAAAAGLYALLLITSSAVLVHGEKVASSLKIGGTPHLVCSYFTGFGLVQTDLWYSANGSWGRSACPRIIRL